MNVSWLADMLSFLAMFLLRLPDFVEEIHKGVVYHESNANIQTYSAQPRYCTLVKSATNTAVYIKYTKHYM